VILYELIAGKTPFDAEQLPQLCTRIFTGAPTPLGYFRPDAPPGLETVLLRCFEKERENRWRNVAEFAAALVPFAPARAVVHAERVAAILGLNEGPSRMTDLLPSAPVADVPPPPRAQALSAGNGGTLDNGSVTRSRNGATIAPRSRGGAVLGVGLGVVVLASAAVGLLRWRGGPSAIDGQPSGIVTGVALGGSVTGITSSPLPESTNAGPQAAPSAVTVPDPATSASASGRVVGIPAPPKLPPRQTPPTSPTATAKASTPPPKRSILEKD
jgi:serine/threonine-protein kinase